MRKKFNKGYFERKEYNRGRNISHYDFAYFNLIKSLIKKNSQILEIGPSYGNLLMLLEKKYNTTGFEISQHALNNAKKKLKKTKLILGDFEKTKKINGQFDAIVAIDVFEHFKIPKKVIKKCYELLNEEGVLIIKIPNKKSVTLKLLKLLNRENEWKCYDDPTHYSVLELKEWIKILKNQGFKVKIMASPPTNFLKRIFMKKQRLFFNKLNLICLNETITLIGKK